MKKLFELIEDNMPIILATILIIIVITVFSVAGYYEFYKLQIQSDTVIKCCKILVGLK